jgi:hypothetical protein
MRASLTAVIPVLVVLVPACGPSNNGDDTADDAPITDAPPPQPDAFAGPFPDFPADPILDGGAPATAGALFGDPSSGAPTGGPCLIEPEVGTIYPRNWLRPRFSWLPAGGSNLYELRLDVASQVNDLVVYTTATTWTMPAAMWTALANHSVEDPIAVTIRGATWDGSVLTAGPALGSSGAIAIAAAEAPGAIVYWTTSGGTGLRGFRVGDEAVTDVVRPADASTACVGCHSSTPDGIYVGFSASANPGNGDPATLGMLSADGTRTTPPFITAEAQTLMARQNQENPVFSAAHWQPGDRIAVTMFPIGGVFQMMWTDLETTSTAEGTGWGVIGRTGDGGGAASASFGHTTDELLYVSAPSVGAGVTVTQGDLMTVPYNGGAGGAPTAIAGAATADNEYYPTFAPDDRYVAYNRVPGGASSYNNAAAEVFVVPRAGGTPIRIAANDPPACSGRTSPGVTNSWPKWAPGTTDVGGRRYYWLTFSSTRGTGGNPQLYVTPVVDAGGTVTTYPALYLWNQPAGENNHTPAWDNFSIIVN